MKQPSFVFAVLCFTITACSQSNAPKQSAAVDVFVGTSLCGEVAKPLLKIPAGENCDRIKWELTLYKDPNANGSTDYKLTREYGYHIDNRTFQPKGTITIEGKWVITKGTKTDPAATVYQLDPDDPGKTLLFLKIDDNLLHLLDKDKNLMVGDGGQSYTLSRKLQ